MNDKNINTNLYSRQIATYGIKTMIKLSKMNIFLYGMRGVGVEVAKNIILSGPNKVTIFDPNKVLINDLTSNFFLNEKDVFEKKRRDEACFNSLLKLNPLVKLEILRKDSITEHIKGNSLIKDEKYDVVVITQFLEKDILIEIDNLCRENNIGFIYGTELGIIGFCFVDFGKNFKYYEKEDEEPPNLLVNSISKSSPGIVNLVNPINKSYKNKDYITFKGVEGMTELNNSSPIQIEIIDKYNIKICDTSNFSNYISGGIIMKAKNETVINFDSFETKFKEPYNKEQGFPGQIDFVNRNSNEIIHLGILGLNEYYKNNNEFPKLNDEKDAQEMIRITKKILDEKENEFWINGLKEEYDDFDEFFEKIIKYLSFWSRAQISPISSFLGGLIAQEIIKYTGKYIPINQWFWCNFYETVENLIGKKIDRTLHGTRYDDQISIFGNEIQKSFENSNIFIVGAGALGCEYMKTFSLMGFSSDKEKNNFTFLTDDDLIVESNLNRQFLFRKDDIGKYKSKIASERAKLINPYFNCVDLISKIGPENENKFDEKFWSKQNYVIIAVDNVEARKYISEQCLLFKKVLIDSGTKGTKANSQVIIPNKTINYSPGIEDEDEGIPMCTLRNYPTSIDHCIEWARDNFNGYFVDIIKNVKSFIENREEFYLQLSKECIPKLQIEKLNKIIRYVKIILNNDFVECLKIAMEEYNEIYYESIIRILEDHPPNSFNPDGSYYWSKNKRCPNPLPFNNDNELAFLFVKKYAQILAESMSIPINNEDEYQKKILSNFKNNYKFDFKGKNEKKSKYERYKNVKINEGVLSEEAEKKMLKMKKKEEIEKRIKLSKEKLNKIKEEAQSLNIFEIQKNISKIFNIQEFEKDNDLHIDFIYSASNLKAEIYRIEKCDKIKVKLKAGKIIPAISTTTASIVGLVSLQLYTLSQTNDIKYLREHYFNFAINSFNFCYPTSCMEIINENFNQFIPKKFTFWDYIEVNISMTIEQFIKFIKEKYLLDVLSIEINNQEIVIPEMNKNENKAYNSNNYNISFIKKIEDIYKENFKELNKKYCFIKINTKLNNSKIEMPLIKYKLK